MKTLLKNGTVVSGDMSVREDVLIDGEKIVKVGRNLEAEDAQVVDVNGKLLFPGFIDGHTHFDLEVAGTVTADDFETGTRAAIAGGTTLVIDYASQDKGGHTLKEGLDDMFITMGAGNIYTAGEKLIELIKEKGIASDYKK